MAGATGLEPATSGVTGRRSNQLSYAPAILDRGETSYVGAPGVSSNSPGPPVSPRLQTELGVLKGAPQSLPIAVGRFQIQIRHTRRAIPSAPISGRIHPTSAR